MNNISNVCSFLVEGKTKDKNDIHVKKESSKYEKDEIIPTKLSYRDVLVTGGIKSKGTVNENNNEGNLVQELERLGIGHPSKNTGILRDIEVMNMKGPCGI